jgi:septal ring factor EnvC (AmiA/AmiB activator)
LKHSTTSTRTLKLATARLEFSRDRRIKNALHLIAVVALVCLVITIGRHIYSNSQAPGARLANFEQQNAALREDLARTVTELELERSTRAALALQVAELTEETSELKRRLDFFNSQTNPSGKTR